MKALFSLCLLDKLFHCFSVAIWNVKSGIVILCIVRGKDSVFKSFCFCTHVSEGNYHSRVGTTDLFFISFYILSPVMLVHVGRLLWSLASGLGTEGSHFCTASR